MSQGLTAGRYRVLGRIATGGMGEVYRARMATPDGLEKTVALKVVRSDLAESERFERLFVAEARIAMAMSHANVVQAFDVGRLDDRWFIAMEHIDGVDLAMLLRACRRAGRPLPLVHALTIAVEALKGIDYAHRLKDEQRRPLGIVHRDISPVNILVSFEGEVKVADFGVAKSDIGSRGSETGSLKGKLAYMPPEQLRAGAIDGRADLYGMGAVIYEMIAGRRAIQGNDAPAVIEQVLAGRIPRLREVAPETPERLERIVARAMSVAKEDRHPSAAAMRQDLEELAVGLGLLLSTAELGSFAAEHARAAGGGEEGEPESPARREPSGQRAVEGLPFDLRLGAELERVQTTGHVSVFVTRPVAAAAGPPSEPPTTIAATPTGKRASDLRRSRGGYLALGLLLGAGAAALVAFAFAGGRGDAAPPDERPAPPQEESAGPQQPEQRAEAPVPTNAFDAPDLPPPLPPPAPAPADPEPRTKRRAGPSEPGPVARAPETPPPPVEVPPPPDALGTLSIASDPWANVTIDGRPVGRTTLRNHRIAPGRHEIVLSNPAAGLQRRMSIVVAPGGTHRMSVRLGEPE